MVARRTDARRRRVLSEEFVPTDESAVGSGKKPMQAYSYGANRRNQPKTTDMIPKREATKSFAISGPGTLSNWVCSVSLFLCSGICFQLFFLRKHKRDDYGGMYRVWILMAIMFLVASIDCAIDLRLIAAKLFEYLTHRSLLQTPWLMMTIELIVLAVIVIRMLFEVRTSKFTLAVVLLVWVGFVGCIVLNNSNVLAELPWVDQQVAYGNCVLAGCVGSLVALTFYARFVFLHAHGLIQLQVDSPVATKTKPAKKAKPAKEVKLKLAERPEAKPEEKVESKPVAKTAPKATPKPAKAARKAAISKAETAPEPVDEPKPKAKPEKTKKAGPLASMLNRVASPRTKPATTAAKPPQKTKSAAEPTAETPQETLQDKAAPAKPARKAPVQKKPVQKKPATTESKPVAATNGSSSSAEDQLQQELDRIDSSAVSKAERRRLRKLAKRTAREKKAA